METRNIEYDGRYYGYGAPCQVTNNSGYLPSDILTRYEAVESYRGKPLFIEVCGKRRKMFNAFFREKFTLTGQTDMSWCPPGKPTLWAEHYPYKPIYNFCLGIGYAEWGTGELPYMRTTLQELGEDLRDFAIRDMFAKATSPRFDGAVFLAELDETLVSVRKLLTGSFYALTRHAKGKGNIKNIILNPQDLWLWWRYALMPAMMDAEDLIAALEPAKVIDRVQDGGRIELTTLDGESIYWGHWQPTRIAMPCKWRCKYRGGYGGAMDIAKRFDPHPWGTSSWDVIRASWERIPFSFIADWFVNVGDWLASLRSLEIVYAQSYASYAVESWTTFAGDSPEYYCYVDGEATAYNYIMERIIDLDPPSLPLVDKRWNNVLRTIDLISLTIGMLKNILTKRR